MIKAMNLILIGFLCMALVVASTDKLNKKPTVVVDNGCKVLHYPIGTFEYEVKHTE